MRINFLITLVSFTVLVSAKPVYFSKYNGIFGRLCDKAAKRFERFGSCVSQIPQFQKLSSTFWYQAAKRELCGTSDPVYGNSSTVKVTLSVANRHAVKPVNAQDLLKMPDDDMTGELQAQYLYDLKRMSSQVATTGKRTNTVSLDKKDFVPGDFDPEFGISQCLNLCDIIQNSTNELSQCWSVFGMTVVYGVCEIGCRFYF